MTQVGIQLRRKPDLIEHVGPSRTIRASGSHLDHVEAPADPFRRAQARRAPYQRGARLWYHGDFDWSGLGIGNLVMRRYGARPWRFSTCDYSAAPPGAMLTGNPVEASWDPDLTKKMKELQRTVHEEQVLDGLLRDLRERRPG